MRDQIEADHRQERCAPAFIEAIDSQFNSIDMMSPRTQPPRANTPPAQAVDDRSDIAVIVVGPGGGMTQWIGLGELAVVQVVAEGGGEARGCACGH